MVAMPYASVGASAAAGEDLARQVDPGFSLGPAAFPVSVP
jgi:hypothetical protein